MITPEITEPGAGRIDVHAHYFPPVYLDALDRAGIGAAGGFTVPAWTPDLATAFMDRHGIAAQVLGISDPALSFMAPAAARSLAKEINEYAAALVAERPDRFGALAVLPLPDVDGAVAQVTYGLDVLGLDGVGVLSSYNGIYLGDPRLDPLLAALDERSAYVMVHPATPPAGGTPDLAGVPAAIVEYPFDTTRAVTNLIWKGAIDRFPRIRWALAHAGGTAPFLAYRITGYVNREVSKAEIPWDAFAHFYYDTALNPFGPALRALLEITPLSHVLFGADWPFAAPFYGASGDPQPQLDTVFTPAERRAVDRDNALALLPRLAAALGVLA